jgi:polyferredoxin
MATAGVRAIAAALPALALTALVACAAHAQPSSGEPGFNFDDVEDAAPSLIDLARTQAPDIALFAAFATLAMVSFLRKSVRLKYLTLVVCVAYMGFYKSQLISIVNVFGTLTGNLPIFSYSLAWYAFAGFTVVTTLLWGRVYCGRICAFGALTQLIDAVVPARFRVELPKALERRASYIKYGILAASVGYYLLTREIGFYRYIEPFWMFTLKGSTVLWVMLGALLIASVFVRNLYCRFLCPLGAALGLVSTIAPLKIKRWSECNQCALCEKTCEWGAIRKRQIVMSECVRCDDCERLYDDRLRCPHWLLDAKRQRRDAEQRASAGITPASALETWRSDR